MLQRKLEEIRGQNRYRNLHLRSGIDLSSNDYLGMANHPALREAAIKALHDDIDIGAAGSRLLRGHTQQHQDLEEFAASYYNAERVLFFANGFQANFGLLTTLPDRKDVILYDELVHASIRDGLTTTKAKSFKFAHNNIEALRTLLDRHREAANHLWIVVEGLYSMDGDMPDLEKLYALVKSYDATLIVDEAHSTGIWGATGRGVSENIIRENGYENLIVVHGCGKAIGVAGGMICASGEVIEYMINAARPFIYSTAPMPLQALLVQKSLALLDETQGQKQRDKLKQLCQQAQKLFGGSGTQIMPIMIGDDHKAVQIAQKLQADGYDIRAIRPPTVPVGSARLRLSLNSGLDHGVLQAFADALQREHDT